MNQTVKTHAQNIVATAKNSKGFSKHGNVAESYGNVPISHEFFISNIEYNPIEVSCTYPIVNIEMALDILQVAHELLESEFDREYFKTEFSNLELDLDKPVYLVYMKYIG